MGQDQREYDKEDQHESDEGDEPEFHESAVKNRLSLRTEIENLISPHRHSSDQKPPFSVKELVVMAVICSDTIGTTEPAIFGWIIYTFQYCCTLAVQQYVQYMVDGLFGGIGVPNIVVDYFYVDSQLTRRRRDGEEAVYSITPEEARTILKERLEPPPRSSSPRSRPNLPSQSSPCSDCSSSAAKSSQPSRRRASCFPDLFGRVLRLRLRPASSRIEPTIVSDK